MKSIKTLLFVLSVLAVSSCGRIGKIDSDGNSGGVTIFQAADFFERLWNSFSLDNNCDPTSTNCSGLNTSWTPRFNNLMGYWTFDTNFQDYSGKGNHGVSSGAVSFAAGKVYNGLEFYASDDQYVEMDAPIYNNEYTFSTWYKSNLPNAEYESIFTFVNADSTRYLTIRRNWYYNQLYVAFRHDQAGPTPDNQKFAVKEMNPGDSVWHQRTDWCHIAVTLGGGEIKIYFNGKLAETLASGDADSTISVGKMRIGQAQVSASVNGFNGKLDELAHWNVALDASEISTIYEKQRAAYAGTYTSPVFNLGVRRRMLSLNWETSLPYGKELSAEYDRASSYKSINENLMSDLILLYQMNEDVWTTETDAIKDTSGNEINGSRVGGVDNITSEGMFNGAANFTGDGTRVEIVPSGAFDPDATLDYSVNFWIEPKISAGVPFVSKLIEIPVLSGGQSGYLLSMWLADTTASDRGRVTLYQYNGTSGEHLTLQLEESKYWQMITVTKVGPDINFYLNGSLVMSRSAHEFSGFDITKIQLNANGEFEGKMDEFGFWRRGLGADEVKELYLRGALNVKIEVRHCRDADCADGVWGGFESSQFFTERNNTKPINPFFNLLNLPIGNEKKRFFQLRATLESDDEVGLCDGDACFPDLSHITVRAE